ncbi:MAG TPA: YkgJ family cysteine cluster protein [Dissulfurispiraceae bacterium]
MTTPKLTRKQQLCISCRKCCEAVGVYTDPDIYSSPRKELVHFYKERGFEVTLSEGYLFLVLDLPCPHLTRSGCAIYRKRPKLCKEYSGVEDFGKDCLWSTLPEYLNRKRRKR